MLKNKMTHVILGLLGIILSAIIPMGLFYIVLKIVNKINDR